MSKQKQIDDFFGLDPGNQEKGKDGIKETILKKANTKMRLKFLPKILTNRERYAILVFLIIIFGSIISIPFTTYYHFTEAVPDSGGSFSEGVVGEPRYINPLLSQTNDSDRDLVNLIYSSLLEYNNKGKLIPGLAKSYEISTDGLNYTVYLREGLFWHDGAPLTADDIIFTVQTAQNPDYGSLQRINWQGVQVEKADELTVIFKLSNKYAQFLNNLSLPIIPKHIWENVKPINFSLTDLNLKPIGSGPFKFEKFQRDRSGRIQLYELRANDKFYAGKPYISKIEIRFYNSEDEMINAYNRNEIDSIGFISSSNLGKLKFKQRLDIKNIKMPRYFGVFFNQNQSAILSDKNIRLALYHATNREALIKNILDGNGISVNSPLIGEIVDINEDVKSYGYDRQLAKDILEAAGWAQENESGILTKNDERLSLRLTTSTWPELIEVAQSLKEMWKDIGIEINIEVLPTPELQQVIKERNYQMLLFGEITNIDPDPFSLWHSSQRQDPGLNLALYNNDTADSILEEARQILNPIERKAKYDDFQKVIIEDIPAIFLYSPLYLYPQSSDIESFANEIISTPSDRFSNIETWFIETKRVF